MFTTSCACRVSRCGGFVARDTAVRAASTTRATKKTTFAIADALDMVKDHAKAKFDETVEMAMVLNVDPRKSNENVRGSVILPKGSGKQARSTSSDIFRDGH